MKTIFSYIFSVLTLTCCTPSKYNIVDPRPILRVSAPQSCEEGHTFPIEISVVQEGGTGSFALSLVLIQGQATVASGGASIPMDGKWTSLSKNPERFTITPESSGTLEVNLQVKSSDGSLSDNYCLRIDVGSNSGISAEATCPAQLINPEMDTTIPIQLDIKKVNYNGLFSVSAMLLAGKGMFFKDGHAVNDMKFTIGESGVIDYNPATLGEHVIEFAISDKEVTTKAYAYIDVIKDIVVSSDVKDCFTFKGAERHNAEGKAITLSLVNNPGFNFEVAGWYDGSKLLASTPTYTLNLSKGCLSALSVKLIKRAVTISQNNKLSIEFKYLVQVNGVPTVKSVWDCRTSLSADYNASETISFIYEAYEYNKSVTPPVGRKYPGGVAFSKGSNWAGYFYRLDGEFDIYLRKEDNPDLMFSPRQGFVESANTRYYIPSNIIMQ